MKSIAARVARASSSAATRSDGARAGSQAAAACTCGECMPAPGPCALAIDIGTSGPKAAIVSLRGGILATARAHVGTIFLAEDGVEQDPEALWTAVKAACATAVRESGVAARDVLAVICSSQYSSIVPVDARGRPTMNMVLWLDKRGSRERLSQHWRGFAGGAAKTPLSRSIEIYRLLEHSSALPRTSL